GTYITERHATEGDDLITVPVPADRVADARWIVIRNTAHGSQCSEVEVTSVDFVQDASAPPKSLREVTLQPFKPKAFRGQRPRVASINTTEVCNLSCVMCHFNGPQAVQKAGALVPAQVEKVLVRIPKGEEIWFCATGEFFMDPNALAYLRRANE